MKGTIWLLLFSGLLCFHIARGETRTFTNKSGQSIEAELLEVVDETIRIRRISDGKEFVIPVASLSLEGRAFVATQKQANAAGGDDWRTLRVYLPGVRDTVSVVGCSSDLGSLKNGRSNDLIVPKGAWLKISYWSDTSIANPVKQLVRFSGAQEWKIRGDGPLMYVSKDGQPEELAGLSMRDESVEDAGVFLRRFDLNDLGETISIFGLERDFPSGLDRITKGRKFAVVASSSFRVDELRKLKSLRPAAMDLFTGGDTLPTIGEFQEIESLELNLHWPWPEGQGKDQFPADELRLKSFPKVRDLCLRNVPLHDELAEILISNGGLRMLEFAWNTQQTKTLSRKADWKNIGGLANSLQALRYGPAVQVPGTELEKLVGLRVLSLHPGSTPKGKGDFFLPQNLKELLVLECYPGSVDRELIQLAVDAGYFPKLRRLSGVPLFSMPENPQLEALLLSTPEEGDQGEAVTGLQLQKSLRKLCCNSLKKGELVQLAALPCAGTIEHLRISNSQIETAEPFPKFASLTNLELSSAFVLPVTLDLSKLPQLARFYLNKDDEVDAVTGVLPHDNLRSLSVRGCSLLKSLGSSSPNSVLESVNLSQCDSFSELDVFSECQALQHFYVTECEKVQGSMSFLKKNPLVTLAIRDCPFLPDMSTFDLRD